MLLVHFSLHIRSSRLLFDCSFQEMMSEYSRTSPRDLLGSVIPMRSPALGGLHRLTVNDRSAGGGLAPDTRAHLGAQGRAKLLPDASVAPFSKVVIHRGPGRKVARQQAPGAATAQHVEDRVQDLPQIAAPGTPTW